MKRKLIIFTLLLALVLSLTACGAAPSDPAQVETTEVTESVTEQTESSEEALPEVIDIIEEEISPSDESDTVDSSEITFDPLYFRTEKQLNEHYEKHGIEMGFESAEDYEYAANLVINNPDVLHKTEKEDGDDVYYLEETNEFVVVSTDGYIRTYFWPNAGKSYYDKQ